MKVFAGLLVIWFVAMLVMLMRADGQQTANSSTASAFDHSPTTCTAGNAARGIDSQGNALNCTAVPGSAATPALDNLASVNINSALLFQTGLDIGSTTKPARDLYLYGSGAYGTTYFRFTGTPTGTRLISLPDTNSNTVQADTGAANNFLTGISSAGVISKAQPSFSNISGTATLTQGGTNASLTASNGGVIWSNATQFQVLAGTATANQILLSGATATPAWSTATYPATASTAGNIVKSDGTNFSSANVQTATANQGPKSTGSTTFNVIASTAAADSFYKFSFYAEQTAAGSGGTCSTNATVVLNLRWTGPANQTQNSATVTLTLTPTLGGNNAVQNIMVRSKASTALTVVEGTFTNGNCSTQPTYTIWGSATIIGT